MIIPRSERLNHIQEYYFSIKRKEVQSLISEGKDIINLGIGSPDLPPSQITIDALDKATRNPNNHGYPPYAGIPEIRLAMAKWYKKIYDVELNPNSEVLPLMGSKEGITHISLAFLNLGDKVLVPELGYPAYSAVSKMVGAEIIKLPMDENTWEPDFEALERMDLEGVKIMWLNYPNMPTGTPASKPLFEKVIAFAQKHKILVCHDNPYSLIQNIEKPISILSIEGAKEVAIELNSMSKSHNMSGWRIGWISGKSSYLNEILKIKSNFDSGMFKPLQLAAVEALENDEDSIIEQNKIYKNRKTKVFEILNLLNCTYKENQVGLFVWAKLDESVNSAEEFVDHLLYKYNLFIAPGFIFGEKGKRNIRLSLCTSEDRLDESILRLQNFSILK